MLDEPTNDLDMDTLDLLEEVLADMTARCCWSAMIAISSTVLVTSVIAVEGDGDVAEYVGGYTDYVRQRPTRDAAKSMVKTAAGKRRRRAPTGPRRRGSVFVSSRI